MLSSSQYHLHLPQQKHSLLFVCVPDVWYVLSNVPFTTFHHLLSLFISRKIHRIKQRKRKPSCLKVIRCFLQSPTRTTNLFCGKDVRYFWCWWWWMVVASKMLRSDPFIIFLLNSLLTTGTKTCFAFPNLCLAFLFSVVLFVAVFLHVCIRSALIFFCKIKPCSLSMMIKMKIITIKPLRVHHIALLVMMMPYSHEWCVQMYNDNNIHFLQDLFSFPLGSYFWMLFIYYDAFHFPPPSSPSLSPTITFGNYVSNIFLLKIKKAMSCHECIFFIFKFHAHFTDKCTIIIDSTE